VTACGTCAGSEVARNAPDAAFLSLLFSQGAPGRVQAGMMHEIEEAFSPGSEARQTEARSPPPPPVRPALWRSKPPPAAERSVGGTAASRSGSSVRTQSTGIREDPSRPRYAALAAMHREQPLHLASAVAFDPDHAEQRSWRDGTERHDSPTAPRCRDVALYRATNGSSVYPYDPEYGGKLSMRTYIARDENRPAPPPVLPEKPHIVDDVAARYCRARALREKHDL